MRRFLDSLIECSTFRGKLTSEGASTITGKETVRLQIILASACQAMKIYISIAAYLSICGNLMQQDSDKAIGTSTSGSRHLCHCRSGWGLPWAIRVRVAELLMASGFDPSDKGQAVAEQEQLVYILRHHLWPILSLPTSLHDLLNAWAYLRQFALTGTQMPSRNCLHSGSTIFVLSRCFHRLHT